MEYSHSSTAELHTAKIEHVIAVVSSHEVAENVNFKQRLNLPFVDRVLKKV